MSHRSSGLHGSLVRSPVTNLPTLSQRRDSRSSTNSSGSFVSSKPRGRLTPSASPPTPTSSSGFADSESVVDVMDYARTCSPPQAQSGNIPDTGDSSAPQVCLCAPERKIPRPRNKFMLYRQHHQAILLKEDPSLTNPTVSSILGKQWKNEPPHIRDQWEKLANDEKSRHRQLYPEYRYQPKRPNASRKSEAVLFSQRCQKCGGRSMANPAIPASNTNTQYSPQHLIAPSSTLGSTQSSQNLTMTTSSATTLAVRRGGEHMMVESPDESAASGTDAYKRRRLAPTSILPYSAPKDSSINAKSPPPFHERFESFSLMPKPEFNSVQSPFARQSPLRVQSIPFHLTRPVDLRDGNLTLPPLQNIAGMSGHPPKSPRMDSSIPFLKKINILGDVSLAFKSNPGSFRGAIIAVEGDDLASTEHVFDSLAEFLSRDTDYTVRVDDGPLAGSRRNLEHAVMTDYHQLIQEWHVKSRDMEYFITTPDQQSSSSESAHNPPESSSLKSSDVTMAGNIIVKHEDTHQTRRSSNFVKPRLPLMLLRGYQLAAANKYASLIPVTDKYTSADHWRWMATMWRSVVGPDITVYVQDLGITDNSVGNGKLLTSAGERYSAHHETQRPNVGLGLGITDNAATSNYILVGSSNIGCNSNGQKSTILNQHPIHCNGNSPGLSGSTMYDSDSISPRTQQFRQHSTSSHSTTSPTGPYDRTPSISSLISHSPRTGSIRAPIHETHAQAPSSTTSDNDKLFEVREDSRVVILRRRKGQPVDERALRRVGYEVGELVRSIGCWGDVAK